MKAKITLIMCCVVGIRFSVLASGHACFTAKVVDEEGVPMPSVPVGAAFLGISRFDSVVQEGITDTNGEVRFKGATSIFGNANFGVNAIGCYESVEVIKFKAIVTGRWQPWNPVVTAVVRRIVNPIPMYAKRVETKIPAENVTLGFDLLIGDWVLPYGSGQTSDFSFSFTKRISGPNDFEGGLAISFTNTFDGILENKERSEVSVFHLPRFAPNAGFQTNWCVHISEDAKTGCHGDLDVFSGGNPGKSYFFRTRSKKDVNGNFLEANYGKMDGELRVIGVARPGSEIMFTYYLNPTPNDRNMEFDPKRNLLQNLKSTEEVRAP